MGGPAKDILSEIELDEKENFTQRQIEKFKTDPAFYRKFVKTIEQDSNGAFALVCKPSLDIHIQAIANSSIHRFKIIAQYKPSQRAR